jgi:lincosamide nucleotidyltransferase A/C/D/E
LVTADYPWEKYTRMTTEMTSSALLELLLLLEDMSVEVWLDGGWGVDALLETQTRSHKDVDIIMCVSDVPMFQEALERRGFKMKEGSPPNSLVLANGSGLEVDVHAVVFDNNGNGIYRMENGQDWVYPAEGFGGSGSVEGMKVKCLSPTTQVFCHAYGYTPAEKDIRDMELIKERFGVELPPQLKRKETQ